MMTATRPPTAYSEMFTATVIDDEVVMSSGVVDLEVLLDVANGVPGCGVENGCVVSNIVEVGVMALDTLRLTL